MPEDSVGLPCNSIHAWHPNKTSNEKDGHLNGAKQRSFTLRRMPVPDAKKNSETGASLSGLMEVRFCRNCNNIHAAGGLRGGIAWWVEGLDQGRALVDRQASQDSALSL